MGNLAAVLPGYRRVINKVVHRYFNTIRLLYPQLVPSLY